MNYQWIWKGKAIPLNKLHLAQINSIQKTLIKHKGTKWFNIDSVDWRKAIKEELDRRKIININKSVNKSLTQFKNYNICITKMQQE